MKQLVYIILATFIVMSCSEDGASNSETLGGDQSGQGGSLARFSIAGDYLYAVDEFGLNVFNIETAGNPVFVNQIPIGFAIETLFGYKDYLYIGSQNGMFIYSITNPEFPEQLSSVEHFTACDPVVANDTHAFVTLWSDLGCGTTVNQLEIYDVEDPLDPILINTRNLTFPKGLGLYGDYLIVCDDEIKIFDVSTPENSTLVHSINRLAFDVIITGDLLIAIGEGGLYQYRLDQSAIENVETLSSLEF